MRAISSPCKTMRIIIRYKMPLNNCFLAVQSKEGQAFRVQHAIECRQEHAFSALLTITNYLMSQLPEIDPPAPKETLQLLKTKKTAVFNPLFQFWHEYLLKCIQEGLAQRHENNFYICIPVNHLPTSLLENSKSLKLIEGMNIDNVASTQKCSKIFDIPVIQRNKKACFFIVSSIQQSLPVFSRFSSAAIMIGIFFNNQQWEIFDLIKGNVPTVQHLKTLDIVLIPGSTASVFNPSQQITSAIDNLIAAYSVSNSLKIVGICFGHQLIAKKFGGQIVKKAYRKDITAVTVNKHLIQDVPYLQSLKDPQQLLLSELNEDFVETVPTGFDVLAYSQACKVEAMLSQNRRILTTQFHSEYLFDHLEVYQRQLRSLGAQIPDDQTPKQVIEGNNKHSVLFLEVIKGFMDE